MHFNRNRDSEKSMSSSRPGRLPVPDQAALAHSHRLQALILQQIEAAGGQLPFDRFMELALYAPGLGYYTAGLRKFGAAGDFITAPEASPLFARCLARQCRQVFNELADGELLEFGAGSGVLAADLLAELERLDALPSRYLILELSAELRQRQRETLARQTPHLLGRVEWLNDLPEAGFSGVAIANEVLDAMPVHRFCIHAGGIREQVVTAADDGALQLQWLERRDGGLQQAAAALQAAYHLPDDYQSEINLRAEPWLQALAERLGRGLVLLIDYGHSQAGFYHPQRNRGTLMCHYRHRAHADPLLYPGLQDITAHVDFTRLALQAQASGLDVCGYTTQAFFLMGAGLEQLVAASDPEDVAAHMALMQGVKQLTLPSEMGERFKVLGLCRGLAQPPMGFALQDLRGRL